MSRSRKLSTRREGANGTTLRFENTAQALSFDYINSQLGLIGPATQITLTCRADGETISGGRAVKLTGIDTDGIPLVATPGVGEGALIFGVNSMGEDRGFATSAILDGETGPIVVSGYARHIDVWLHPTTGFTLNPGDSIYPYSGAEDGFTAYDSVGAFCGTVLEQQNNNYCDIMFVSPRLTAATTPDGILSTQTTRLPSNGNSIAHGELAKHGGSVTNEGMVSIAKWVEGTDDSSALLGICPYAAAGRLALVTSGQVAVPVNGSPALGAAVYAEATTSSITTVSTSGVQVGIILKQSGANWIIDFRQP